MHSHKDIENKSVFLINGSKNQIFRVQNGFLCIQNSETKKALTKLPFPKMLCIMIIGHTSITTSFIEHANKHGVPSFGQRTYFSGFYRGGIKTSVKPNHFKNTKFLSCKGKKVYLRIVRLYISVYKNI